MWCYREQKEFPQEEFIEIPPWGWVHTTERDPHSTMGSSVKVPSEEELEKLLKGLSTLVNNPVAAPAARDIQLSADDDEDDERAHERIA